ncbi:MAG: transcription antitermination factor NusB [Deltaproteobacteria bacterium]|nr:MAG: transcription antitermination factor NusB [Deltaproteobacteria bacterium]
MSRGIRRQGREMAVKVLFSLADHEGGSLEHVLGEFWKNFQFRNDVLGDAVEDDSSPQRPEVRHFAELLISGVAENLESLDREIKSYSTNWALDRMSRVDLAILRLAAYELIYCLDVPLNVVINEAIELSKRFGTEESPSFINGVLDHLAKQHRTASS